MCDRWFSFDNQSQVTLAAIGTWMGVRYLLKIIELPV